MKIAIEIEIGNEAMQNWEDAKECLDGVFSRLSGEITDGQEKLFDSNGNTVGFIKVSE